jgi:type I restriction enzyme S subunit
MAEVKQRGATKKGNGLFCPLNDGLDNSCPVDKDGEVLEENLGKTRGMSEWSEKPLGTICSIKTGKKDVNEGSPNGAYPFFTCSRDVHASDSYSFDTDAILIAGNGAVGDTKLYRGKFEAYQRTYVLDGFEEDLDFIFYVLKGFLSEALSKVVSGSTMPYIRKGDLEQFPIPLPPRAEQQKIAYILSTVQRAIEVQERIIQTMIELKKTLMHQFFTQGLRNEAQKQSDIGLVPKSWEVTTVGSVARIQSGGTPSRDNPEYWQDGTIPWVKTGEIDYCVIKDAEEKITAKGLKDSAARLFPKGTLLMAMYGQGVTRGRVGLLGVDAATNQACAAIMPSDEKKVSSHYLYYFFEYHYEDLRKLGHGANQRNMNAALIRSFPLAFPKPDEQAELSTAFKALDEKRVLHERKKTQLQDLFRTILHELMTANIRIHEMENIV